MRFLYIITISFSLFSCKNPKDNKEHIPENSVIEIIPPTEDTLTIGDIVIKDFREFKVLDSKYIKVVDLWQLFADELKDFSDEVYQSLKPFILDLYKKRNLAELLEALVKVEGIEWIRLHYAFPTGFPMDVLDVMNREPKICNYLDIPLQHISDSILKSMRRGTTKEKTTKLLKQFRAAVPDITIRTTLIVGYPGETEEHFLELKEWIKDMRFERLGCFTYSHEENTHAFNLDDNVPEDVKQDRANEIMELQSQISWELNQEKIGNEFKVVIDRKEGNYFVGRTEFDSPDVDNEVLIDATSTYLKIGDFAIVIITEAADFDLYAEVIN